MSEFEIDNCNAICPYCGASYQVEPEDYTAVRRLEECGSCGETYQRWTEFSVEHYTAAISAAKGDK